MNYKNLGTPGSEDFQFENKISFQGNGKIIERVITKKDFEEVIDFKKLVKLDIELFSFSVDPKTNKIDLIYKLDLGNERRTMTIPLQ